MIELETLKLEMIDYENIEHLTFIKELMESKDIEYLWDLSDKETITNRNKNKYSVLNENNEKIGYLNISDTTEAYYGNTVSLYYAVSEKHRGNNYGKRIITEINKWLLENNQIDCIIAQANINNIHSQNTLTKAGMEKIHSSDEYVTYSQRKNTKR